MADRVPTREETLERMLRGYLRVASYRRDTPYTVADRLEERAVQSPDGAFIIFEGRRVAFAEMNALANRVCRAALEHGLRRGDVVALLMTNRPEFVMTWLGLAKAGIVCALLNTTTTGPVLAHALRQVEPKALIFGSECVESFDTLSTADRPPLLFCQRESPAHHPLFQSAVDLNEAMASADEGNPDPSLRAGLVMSDPLYYIYTSGTTGLSKAARLSHMRFLSAGETMGGMLQIGPRDVHYCVLPLFHGAGGMAVVSIALAFGIPFVLRRKFSARSFWPDVRTHGITVCQYIGEICRYLLLMPPSPDDRQHSLRAMAGAGLKADVWAAFSERFGVTAIFEGLGGTEANYSILNVDGRIGSVGRVPYPEQSNVRVLLYDLERDGHVRDAAGRVIEAAAGQVGELVAEVLPGPGGAGFFEGYSSAEATAAKTVRDLFRSGDCWVRSGDLVRFDEDGYFYFVDRIGDTFRWKSENVSTEEVALVLSAFPGPEVVNVYGVEVPGTEGRAGMAALVYRDFSQFDGAAFFHFATARLAHYAVPLFLRLCREADMTATFKLRKVELQCEGYDPEAAGNDELYVCDSEAGRYVPLIRESLERLGIRPFAARQAKDRGGAS